METFGSTGNKFKKAGKRINGLLARLSIQQDNYLLIIGGITGILAGIGALIFHNAIDIIKELFFDLPGSAFGLESLLDGNTTIVSLLIILIPAVGGLLVGLLAHYFEKGEKGEGIPNVIDSIANKGGVIKGTIAIKKIVGSAISIGTGGAGGKEGPIVQIGASIASAFGQFLHLPGEKLKIVVGCGAAAGLSAAFNAPLGGALFATEVILKTFRAKTFSPIIIASVFATALSRGFLGNQPIFRLDNYTLAYNIELLFYIILGFLCALASVYFVKVFYKIEDLFQKYVKVRSYMKPAVGGLLVGVIALFLPGIYSFWHIAIDGVFLNELGLGLIILLLLMKPVATALTIGSGGNGGTFAPSLFTGAMLGAAFGQVINIIYPEMSAQPGAYALVGMAGVVAGTTHASLTALIMTFEMTDNYQVILPLMLTIIISTTVSKSILKGSLYSIKFSREGKEIDIYGRTVDILKKIRLNTLLERRFDVVHEYINFKKILDKIKKARFNSILVTNAEDQYTGAIPFQHLRDVIMDEDTRSITGFLVAKDVMTSEMVTMHEDDNAEEALTIMENNDLEYIVVLDKESRKIKGIVTRNNLLNRYQKEVFIRQNEEL